MSQLKTHSLRDIFFFSHELTYLPRLYQEPSSMGKETSKNIEHCNYAWWGREMLSPLLAPPTPLWCVSSHCLLMLGFHSKLSLLAHALEQDYPGKERIREDWPVSKRVFVFVHCLKQLTESHRWNRRPKETRQENASCTWHLTKPMV